MDAVSGLIIGAVLAGLLCLRRRRCRGQRVTRVELNYRDRKPTQLFNEP